MKDFFPCPKKIIVMVVFVAAFFTVMSPGWTEQVEATSSCGYSVIGFYDSGDFSERYTQVVLGRRDVIYLLEIPDVDPGDVFDVAGEGEITTSRNTNTEIVSILELYWNNNRWEISEENGENIDLDRHHYKLTGNGWIEVPEIVLPGSTVSIFWTWGAFDGSEQPNWLAVGGGLGLLDYGRLTARHYRPLC